MMKFLISVVVMFILSMAVGFAIHGTLLNAEYAALPSLFRAPADAQQFFGYMIAAHVLMAIGFSWIYIRGKENKPFLLQGVRFGLAVAVLSTIPMYLIYFAVQPMPEALVHKQIIFDTVGTVIMGIAVAFINK